MNLTDAVVILIIGFFSINSYRKGFVRACFSFLPSVISIFATYKIYPFLSKFIRTTGYFTSIKDSIYNSSWLSNIFLEQASESQTKIINDIPVPSFLKESLINNNNHIVYDILDATNIREYIAGYIANVCINILTMIIVFILIFVLCKVIFSILNLFSNLPVISFFNKLSGLAIGLLQGIIIIWIIGIGLTYFYYDPKFILLFDMIDKSLIARYFYENNYLLFMILKIFA